MIIKIYKRVHSKYLKLFNFFFFLRYVFLIFLITTSVFLTTPKFFNYEEKKEIIKKYLDDYYNLEVKSINKIEYKIFPFPNLSVQNLNFKIKDTSINFQSNNINIFLVLKNIYNYKDFKAGKILFKQNKISLDFDESKNLINYFKRLKYKFDIQNLNLYLLKEGNSLINIKNINFSNHGYRKYNIEGKVFDKRFEASLKNNNQNLSFKILGTGIKANFDLNEKDFYSGSSKVNLSNNLLKFNFNLKNNQLEIKKSNFRNKDLSFSFDSIVKFNPFFDVSSNIKINEIDENFMNNISLEKVLKKKEIVKKLNNKINVKYKSKKYFAELIESYSSKIKFAYGRIDFSNEITILGNEMKCKGDSLLTDEYPRLNFMCLINVENKNKTIKKILLSKNWNKKPFSINIIGSLNLLNKKIKFEKINTDNNYLANDEDKKYFEDQFEDILFDESFFQIFKKSKIKKFLLEII